MGMEYRMGEKRRASFQLGGQRIALNTKAKEVVVAGSRSVDIYSFPEIF